MKSLRWTEAERSYPRVNLMPGDDGVDECPGCQGRGSIRRPNYNTLSPSDDFDETCKVCGGLGDIVILDDR